MFERYTEKARRVIFFARYEASVHGNRQIDIDHFLLGFIRECSWLTEAIAGGAPAVESLRAAIEGHCKAGEPISTSVDMPLSPAAQKVLVHAAEEAERLKSRNIDLGHLLLAILLVPDSVAAGLLRQYGVDADAIRQRIREAENARPAKVFLGTMEWDQGAEELIGEAIGQARRLGHPTLLPEHLLLAILALGGSPAAAFLASKGVTEDDIRCLLP